MGKHGPRSANDERFEVIFDINYGQNLNAINEAYHIALLLKNNESIFDNRLSIKYSQRTEATTNPTSINANGSYKAVKRDINQNTHILNSMTLVDGDCVCYKIRLGKCPHPTHPYPICLNAHDGDGVLCGQHCGNGCERSCCKNCNGNACLYWFISKAYGSNIIDGITLDAYEGRQ